MYELIKNNFISDIIATALTGVGVLFAIYGIFGKTKEIERVKIKTILRIISSSALVCLWAWFLIYQNLYPASLAYYEYNHGFTKEKIGIIENIAEDGTDRIDFIIDSTQYTMVHSSSNPFINVDEDIKEGDLVTITFGERSGYIFDLYRI